MDEFFRLPTKFIPREVLQVRVTKVNHRGELQVTVTELTHRGVTRRSFNRYKT